MSFSKKRFHRVFLEMHRCVFCSYNYPGKSLNVVFQMSHLDDISICVRFHYLESRYSTCNWHMLHAIRHRFCFKTFQMGNYERLSLRNSIVALKKFVTRKHGCVPLMDLFDIDCLFLQQPSMSNTKSLSIKYCAHTTHHEYLSESINFTAHSDAFK